jgi:uncharacterized membrane protein YccC
MEAILTDRIIDTAIGSVIAFAANFFLVPVWEHGQITTYILAVIDANARYFKTVAGAFAGHPATTHDFKLDRKNAFVAMANLSDAFNRMLLEPKSKQKNSRDIHQLVVVNHMLTSYTATLAYYINPLAAKYASPDFEPTAQATLANLEASRAVLSHEPIISPGEIKKPLALEQRVRDMMELRKEELRNGKLQTGTRQTLAEFKPLADLFNFIQRAAADVKKLSVRFSGEAI